MSFGWNQAADGGSDRLSEGYHQVKCIRVSRANKQGEAYQTAEGHAQLYTVWENADGAQGLVIFTLSNKAAWTLAQMMKFSGADLDRMEKDGITPDHFTDVEFARKKILDRSCWVHAKPKGQYINLEFVDAETVPADAIKQAVPAGVHQDNIPF